MNLNNLRNIAVDAANNAGKFLNDKKHSNKAIHKNIARDIKLELDRDAENIIRKNLKKTKISILGEEFGGEIKDEYTWVIDPIDGTANYFRGLDQCCISIALLHKDEPVIGIILNFNNNDLYEAIKGEGAYCNGDRIYVSDIVSKNDATLTTGFPASESIESSIIFLEDLQKWKKVRMFGSAALSCAYVASGKCDLYKEKGVYIWDIAAGICIVKEAGGKATYSVLDKNRYVVNFSNGKL